jgi:type VI secretion system secreted protein VgrG
LLIAGLEGREALSELFHFELDLLAENRREIAFDKVVGQNAVVSLALGAGRFRYFSGIVSQLSQGKRDSEFTHFKAELVPQFWLLTQRRQSRIFQHVSVPGILKQVLVGLDVTSEIVGTFHPRDYCVQYRESDFGFASRLMEEEGIYYFFKHDANGHTLVLANTPESHPELPSANLIYRASTSQTRSPGRITAWEKTQQLRPRQYTLRDHCFELPQQTLEAVRPITESVAVGKVTHQLKLPANDKLEIYDFPGAYAQRFDGIASGGGERPADLRKIFEDNERTTKIRMEQETVAGLMVRGAGDCRQVVSGYRFKLNRHFNADGPYVLTSVYHSARFADAYRSGDTNPFKYENRFTCIPADLPFRPPQLTPKPVIAGMQTAVVVGPAGETVFCDKYGRVKVQFFWDREGKKNADSSCWVRVGQASAGQGYGTVSLPRIGHEVIVGFLEGDPDQPIIVGSVFNADNMPPYKLPDQRTYSGVIHRSHHGVAANASEIRFENQLGSELLRIHAETDSVQQAENNHLMQVGKVHRHEVGQYLHTIVGKPVNVNLAAVGAAGRAAGSGAGGGPAPTIDVPLAGAGVSGIPTGSGAGGGPKEVISPDGRMETDTFERARLETDVNGDNVTHITGNDDYKCDENVTTTVLGNNVTTITGTDTYLCHSSASTTVEKNNTTVTGGDDTFTCKGTGSEDYGKDFHQHVAGSSDSTVDGDNSTHIKGDDDYKAANLTSSVKGKVLAFEGCDINFIGLLVEGRVLHLEANAQTHVELKVVSYENAVVKEEGSPIKIISLG